MVTTPETDPTTFMLQEGDEGDNTLVGTIMPDRLLGLGGNDTLVGNEAGDYLQGGGGNDTLTGGFSDPDSGPEDDPDRFVFGRVDGDDTITDFKAGCPDCDWIETPDRIILLDASPEDITALIENATSTPNGDTVLHYGETDVTLTSVSTVGLFPEMFILG